MASPDYSAASACLREAVMADTAGEILRAIGLYKQGIGALRYALAQELHLARRAQVQAKIDEYSERIKVLEAPPEIHDDELTDLEAQLQRLKAGPSTVDDAMRERARNVGVRGPGVDAKARNSVWTLGPSEPEVTEEEAVRTLLQATREEVVISGATIQPSQDTGAGDHPIDWSAPCEIPEMPEGPTPEEIEELLYNAHGIAAEADKMKAPPAVTNDHGPAGSSEGASQGKGEPSEAEISRAADALLEQLLAEQANLPPPPPANPAAAAHPAPEPALPMMPSLSSLPSLRARLEEEPEDEEEETWCCICNEDALFRCDEDLYCQRCLNEYRHGWDAEEIQESPAIPFKPRKKKP